MAECRNKLKADGLAYPKSGCHVVGCQGVFGRCLMEPLGKKVEITKTRWEYTTYDIMNILKEYSGLEKATVKFTYDAYGHTVSGATVEVESKTSYTVTLSKEQVEKILREAVAQKCDDAMWLLWSSI